MSEGRKIMQVRSARQVPVRVQLLDDEILDITVDKRAVGWILFDKVCEHLNVLEKDYFGLNFINPEGIKYWCDNEKKLAKQMKGLQAWNLCFEVKFYPSDPLQMVEDLTRYQLCLQIRRDIVNERVPCSTVTYALLGSFTAQSEMGDFEVEEFGTGTSYLKDIQFAPHQDRDLLAQIAKLHRSHKGLTPEDSELKFLENAKKLALYGVELHPAKDAEGKDIQLGVCASSILVFKDKQQVNRFVWPKILKMSYRRNKFYIKIRPGEFENFASLIGFRTSSVKMAKRLWKISVEHHSFFRFKEPEPTKSLSVIPRFGSRFRYSGRTQYQSRQVVSDEARDSPFFDRVLSKRGTFGGRTQNMKQRDDERRRQRDEMRSRGPPPPVPYTQESKVQVHEKEREHNGSPAEPKRTPPEPRHAPPVAPKPKPVIAPKPKPSPRVGRSTEDISSYDKGSRGSLNDSFDDVPDRRSKMERMHAVMTPLAAVMQKSLDKNKNVAEEEEDRHTDHSDHHDDDRHSDDGYEVGMRVNRAWDRSQQLTHTNDGCRDGSNNQKYLFSYPSTSIDSILSHDCDEYDTDKMDDKHEQKVASDEHLNNSGRIAGRRSKVKGSSLSHSVEDMISDNPTACKGDKRCSDGIYAEIEELKTGDSRNFNTLTHNKNAKPSIIHGKKSMSYRKNQKQILPSSGRKEILDLNSFENAVENILKPYSTQKEAHLKSPNSQVPLYTQVNKNHMSKLPDILPINERLGPKIAANQSDQSHYSEISQIEPHYDSIDELKETSHKRQDSQTSLKEELKMYIISPEKLRQNSSNNVNTKPIPLNIMESNPVDTNLKPQTVNSQPDNSSVVVQVHMHTHEEKPLVNSQDVIGENRNYKPQTLSIDDRDFVDKRQHERDKLKQEDKVQSDTFERKNQKITDDGSKSDQAVRSSSSLYQITFDTQGPNSPDTTEQGENSPKDSLKDESYDVECPVQRPTDLPLIFTASPKSHDNSVCDNQDQLDESLEVFCSLSSDSSDLEKEPFDFRRTKTIRLSTSERDKHLMNDSESNRTEKIQISKGKCAPKERPHSLSLRKPDSENKSNSSEPKLVKVAATTVHPTPTKLESQNISPTTSKQMKDTTAKEQSKPKSMLKKVTSLVKKVPVLGNSKGSNKKEGFVRIVFEKEPCRRKVKSPLTDNKSNSPIDKPKTATKEPSTSSQSTPGNKNDRKPSSAVSNGKNQPMDFFVKPKLLDDLYGENNTKQSPNENFSENIKSDNESTQTTSNQTVENKVHVSSTVQDKDTFENGRLLNDFMNEVKKIEVEPEANDLNDMDNLEVKSEQATHETNKHIGDIYVYRENNIQSTLTKDVENNEDNLINHSNKSTDLKDTKQIKSPDPFWYKTHLLPQNNERISETNENMGAKQENKVRKLGERHLNTGENVSLKQGNELKNAPFDNDFNKTPRNILPIPDSDRSLQNSQLPLKYAKMDSPVQTSHSQSGVPEIVGSKVYIKELCAEPTHINYSMKSPTDIENDSFKTESPVMFTCNSDKVQPLYKLDYSSDTSSTSSVLRDPSDHRHSNTRVKKAKVTHPDVVTQTDSECESNSSVSSTQDFDRAKPHGTKRKISPGVIHMVRPAPAGWIEGGLQSSPTKKSKKQPSRSKRFVSVLEQEPAHTISLPSRPYSVLDFDGTKPETELEKTKTGDKPHENNVRENVSAIDAAKPVETKNLTVTVPMTELLCKRVWKYQKSKLKSSSPDEDHENPFPGAIEKGPIEYDDTDNTQNSPVEVKNKGITDQFKTAVELNPSHNNENVQSNKGLKTLIGRETEHTMPVKYFLGDEKMDPSPVISKAKSCEEVTLTQQPILSQVETHKVTDMEPNRNGSLENKLVGNFESNDESSSESQSTLNTSNDDSSSSSENSGAEYEVASFEMPKPSLSIVQSCEPDLPFVDEDDKKLTTPSLSGFAIDCSMEDVMSYKVSHLKNSQNDDVLSENIDVYTTSPEIDDRYDVNYWDEDIDFDDYDDSFGYFGHIQKVPEVIDDTPHVTKRSNLKSNKKETVFSDRKVHFPEILPVYKSNRNINADEESRPRNIKRRGQVNQEESKMNHMEQFIVSLFDEEPRNLSIPRQNAMPSTSYACSNISQDNQYAYGLIPNNQKNFGFQSALTFENVNLLVDSLNYYSLNTRDISNDVITTDLDAIDYNDEQFQQPIEQNPISSTSQDAQKKDKKSSAKIVKPVTGRKTKFPNSNSSDEKNMLENSSNDEKLSSLNSFGLPDDEYHHLLDCQNLMTSDHSEEISLSPLERSLERPVYTAQCSAELTPFCDESDRVSPINTAIEINAGKSNDVPCTNEMNAGMSKDISFTNFPSDSPIKCHCFEGVSTPHSEKENTKRYGDVSALSQNYIDESQASAVCGQQETDKHMITTVTPSKTIGDKVTKYSYCYAVDSDPESPKIKYVTYEYVTEYKLNNVKIQYQHNKKVQTDSQLLNDTNETRNTAKDERRISSKKNPHIQIPLKTNDKSSGNDSSSSDDFSSECEEVPEEIVEPHVRPSVCIPLGDEGEVIEEIVEPHVRPSVCIPLGDEGEVIEEIVEPHVRPSVCIPLGDEGEAIEEIVEPHVRPSVCIPLGDEGENQSTKIEVEEVNERAVCFPLGPIGGIPSVHWRDTQGDVVEENIERSVCKTLRENTSVEEDRCSGKTEQTLVTNNEEEALSGEEKGDPPKQDDRKVLGKGYTEKQVVEYNSEKFVFQCYQPALYSTERFPRYLPSFTGLNVRKKTNLKDKQEDYNKNVFMVDNRKEKLVDKGSIMTGFDSEYNDTFKDLQDSGYETYPEDPFVDNETDTEDQLTELGGENFYSVVMQEELPDLLIQESTQDKLFVCQAMAVLAFGAVLVFLLPYMG